MLRILGSSARCSLPDTASPHAPHLDDHGLAPAMPHDFNNLTDTPLPDDVISLVVENLHDDRALHACTLVNRAFHVQATKLLYRSLSSRIVQRSHGVCSPLLQVFHFHPL
jgi:hypothetical protein